MFPAQPFGGGGGALFGAPQFQAQHPQTMQAGLMQQQQHRNPFLSLLTGLAGMGLNTAVPGLGSIVTGAVTGNGQAMASGIGQMAGVSGGGAGAGNQNPQQPQQPSQPSTTGDSAKAAVQAPSSNEASKPKTEQQGQPGAEMSGAPQNVPPQAAQYPPWVYHAAMMTGFTPDNVARMLGVGPYGMASPPQQ